MVIYDHWSNMTMLGIHEVVFIALGEGIQIDRLLFEKSREELAIWQKASWNESVRQSVLIRLRQTATTSTKLIF